MGAGIAQVAATAGYSTVVREVEDSFLQKGMASIEKSLSILSGKGIITADRRAKALEKSQEYDTP